MGVITSGEKSYADSDRYLKLAAAAKPPKQQRQRQQPNHCAQLLHPVEQSRGAPVLGHRYNVGNDSAVGGECGVVADLNDEVGRDQRGHRTGSGHQPQTEKVDQRAKRDPWSPAAKAGGRAVVPAVWRCQRPGAGS